MVTLGSFIVGSVLGVAHAPWWAAAPAWRSVSLLEEFGPIPALAMSFGAFGLIAGATVVLERQRHGRVLPAGAGSSLRGTGRLLRGPWPLAWGAVGLALVNVATLVLARRPWGITSALALWGSKILAAVGVDVAAWPYWAAPGRGAQLQASVFRDVTSVMNFGIVVGALAAAGLAGRLSARWRVPARSLLAAVAGGLLLGYGARVAYGCNIGAYFSGVASLSLHGWLWLVAGFAGSVLGTHLRPLFGLAVERSSRPSGRGPVDD